MSANALARLIQNHEGDPIVWVNEIMEHDENARFVQKETSEIYQAIGMSSNYDRFQTANELQVALYNHVAKIEKFGPTATAYELYTADKSRELLCWLIQLITP